MSNEEYAKRFEQQRFAQNVAQVRAHITALHSAGVSASNAIFAGYQFACELLRMQNNRSPLSRMNLAAAILPRAAMEAGVHPEQQRAAQKAERR
jgi:predicted metal-dependent phosphoesterase TrpH